MHLFSQHIIVIFMSLLASSLLSALPGDNKQKIIIEDADKFIRIPLGNGKEKTELTGNVLLTQGSRQIKGQTITIFSEQSKVVKVIARGNPASFTQRIAQNKKPVSAQANEIHYILAEDSLLLTGKATINQEGSTINGDTINYNAATERVSASGADDLSSKVKIVFEPSDSGDEGKQDKQLEQKP